MPSAGNRYRLSTEEPVSENMLEIRRSTTPNNGLDYEDILEEIGFGKTQWILLLISGLITITSMAGISSAGIIAIVSQCEFGMSQTEKGLMIATSLIGVFLSTYFWGYISDAIGRRTALMYGTLAACLLQFMTMFITNIWLYNLFNLLSGISLGSISGAMYPYLSEFNVPKHRAVVINYSTMFVSVTSVYVPAIAWLILSFDWSISITDGFTFRPWRLIILASLLPGFIGALMLIPFPESPKLLLAHQKHIEALAAVEWICKFNTGKSLARVMKSEVLVLNREQLDEDITLTNLGMCGILKNIWLSTKPLFHKPHRVNFIISTLAVFGMFFSSSGLQVWYPEIVNRSSGNAAGEPLPVCDILDASFAQQAINATLAETTICQDTITTKTYVDNIIVGVAFLIGFSIQGTLLNPLGRKNVLLAAMSIATLSGVLLIFITNSTIVLILFCFYILMPGLSISIMLGGLVDLVPTHLRGKAVSIALTIGRLGIIVASNLIGITLEPLCNTTFAIFTSSMLVAAFLVHFLPLK